MIHAHGGKTQRFTIMEAQAVADLPRHGPAQRDVLHDVPLYGDVSTNVVITFSTEEHELTIGTAQCPENGFTKASRNARIALQQHREAMRTEHEANHDNDRNDQLLAQGFGDHTRPGGHEI